MKKLLGIVVLGLLWCGIANANIYWAYEFYKISPQSNIFIIGDSGYQECLKSQLSEKEYNKAIKIESNMSKKMEKTRSVTTTLSPRSLNSLTTCHSEFLINVCRLVVAVW